LPHHTAIKAFVVAASGAFYVYFPSAEWGTQLPTEQTVFQRAQKKLFFFFMVLPFKITGALVRW